jgi:hypothetical protein
MDLRRLFEKVEDLKVSMATELSAIKTKLGSIAHVVDGNGVPSLQVRLNTLEAGVQALLNTNRTAEDKREKAELLNKRIVYGAIASAFVSAAMAISIVLSGYVWTGMLHDVQSSVQQLDEKVTDEAQINQEDRDRGNLDRQTP